MNLLEARNLCHSYRTGDQQVPVLRELNLDLIKGEVVMLLGPSGSGKSSLLNLLAGIELPQQGSIRVNGDDLVAMGESARTRFRRQHIGVIYQFFNLVPTLTVTENLMLPLSLNGRRSEKARAGQFLRRLDMEDKASRFPDQLSGGEQQRVAICRAMIHQPMLLLADEPTGSLDADTAAEVMTLLLEQVRAEQTTLLMVTHSEALTCYADRVYRMQRGQLQMAD